MLLAQQPTTAVSGPPLLCNAVTAVIISGSPAGQPHQLREMLYLRDVEATITSRQQLTRFADFRLSVYQPWSSRKAAQESHASDAFQSTSNVPFSSNYML